MVLIDSSVWINYIKGIENIQTNYLHLELEEGGSALALCPIILQEVLQGFKNNADYEQFKSKFLHIKLLTLSEPESAIKAADIYRNLRKKGITILKANDCIIANYALMNNISLAHNDIDFDQIARVYPLRFVM